MLVAVLVPASAAGQARLCKAPQGAPGPCQMPEPARLLSAADPSRVVVAANFGVLLPGAAGGWQFLCDDLYGTPQPDRVWRAPSGRLFAAGKAGLVASDDGCQWQAPEGELAGRKVADLLTEAGPAGRTWAVAVEPLALLLSTDGGRRFAAAQALGGDWPSARLRVAPSNPQRLYLLASGLGPELAFWASNDGGASWAAQTPDTGGAPLPGPPTLLAVAPDDPERLFVKVGNPEGDQLWRSGDGGRTFTRALALADFELMAGLAFGPTGPSGESERTLYVAGRAPIVVDGGPPGRLYISRDGGTRWQEPVPSAANGPSYRCLEFGGGKLLACAGGEATGEAFLVGASETEGRTWTPVVRLADLRGPQACVRSTCTRTELWLCESYGQCATSTVDAGPPDAPSSDAAAPSGDAAAPPPAPGGCGCTVGAATAAPIPLMLLVVVLLGLLAGVLARGNKSRRRS